MSHRAWKPSGDVERELQQAVRTGDRRRSARAVGRGLLYVPRVQEGTDAFPWPPEVPRPSDSRVIMFTSPYPLYLLLAGRVSGTDDLSLAQVRERAPGADVEFVVNPATPVEITLTAREVDAAVDSGAHLATPELGDAYGDGTTTFAQVRQRIGGALRDHPGASHSGPPNAASFTPFERDLARLVAEDDRSGCLLALLRAPTLSVPRAVRIPGSPPDRKPPSGTAEGWQVFDEGLTETPLPHEQPVDPQVSAWYGPPSRRGVIVAYTSEDRRPPPGPLPGVQNPFLVRTTFLDLVAGWPGPSHVLAINPLTPCEFFVTGGEMGWIAAELDKAAARSAGSTPDDRDPELPTGDVGVAEVEPEEAARTDSAGRRPRAALRRFLRRRR